MTDIIDIRALADRMGEEVDQVHAAGRHLFDTLTEHDSGLTKALVDASAQSGLEPRVILSMLHQFAVEFRRPLATPTSMTAALSDFAGSASDQAHAATARVLEAISAIDLSDTKAKGDEIVGRMREQVAAVDVGVIRDRASQAGDYIADRARSLAGTFGFKGEPDAADADSRKKS